MKVCNSISGMASSAYAPTDGANARIGNQDAHMPLLDSVDNHCLIDRLAYGWALGVLGDLAR